MSARRGVGQASHKPPLMLVHDGWTEAALCTQVDPELFFPTKGTSDLGRAAKQICRQCPVQIQCLQYAIDNHEDFGVWGGLSVRQRRDLARGGRSIPA